MSDRRVAVLSGGLSHERDVSLRSGRRLSAALRSVGRRRSRSGTPTPRCSTRLREQPAGRRRGRAARRSRARAARSRRCWRCSASRTSARDSHACRRAWDKPTAKTELARAGLRDAGLGGAAAQHVPRAGCAAGARRDGRPARAADDAQAGPGRLGARRPGGARRGRPAGRDGRLPRLRRRPCSPSGSSTASRWRSR